MHIEPSIRVALLYALSILTTAFLLLRAHHFNKCNKRFTLTHRSTRR